MSTNEFSAAEHFLQGEANEALTKYRFVDMDGTTANKAKKFSLSDSLGQPIGIAPETVASGDPTAVATSGIGKLEVDGNANAIAAGDALIPLGDSTGKGGKSLVDGEGVGAIALEPSTADGDIIDVLILPVGIGKATATKWASGVETITGTGNVVTGLATITSIVASLETIGAGAGDAAVVEALAHATPGTITLTAIQDDFTTNATGAEEVNWIAFGT